MNEYNQQQNIQEGALKKIRSRGVHARPKAYFIIRLLLTVFVTVLVLFLSAFVVSIIFFSLKESGELFLLGFGIEGIHTFFLLFPWISFCVDMSILAFLGWLIHGFKFGYHLSLFSLCVAIFFCSSILGLIINITPINTTLLHRADTGSLPVLGKIYENMRDSRPDKGIFRGTVESVQNDEIIIKHDDTDHDADDGTRIVILPTQHAFLHIGDRVYVFGTSSRGVIYAHGIQKFYSGQ